MRTDRWAPNLLLSGPPPAHAPVSPISTHQLCTPQTSPGPAVFSWPPSRPRRDAAQGLGFLVGRQLRIDLEAAGARRHTFGARRIWLRWPDLVFLALLLGCGGTPLLTTSAAPSGVFGPSVRCWVGRSLRRAHRHRWAGRSGVSGRAGFCGAAWALRLPRKGGTGGAARCGAGLDSTVGARCWQGRWPLGVILLQGGAAEVVGGRVFAPTLLLAGLSGGGCWPGKSFLAGANKLSGCGDGQTHGRGGVSPDEAGGVQLGRCGGG